MLARLEFNLGSGSCEEHARLVIPWGCRAQEQQAVQCTVCIQLHADPTEYNDMAVLQQSRSALHASSSAQRRLPQGIAALELC